MCVSGGRKGTRAMTRGPQAQTKEESLHSSTAEMTFFRFTLLQIISGTVVLLNFDKMVVLFTRRQPR
jgi:hypothetical protein